MFSRRLGKASFWSRKEAFVPAGSIKMKMKIKMKIRSHRYDINRPTILTKSLRLTLVFMCALREKFNFCFSRDFLLVLTKFSFWQQDWALGYHSMKFRHFPNISWFPKILSLKLFANSWGNSWGTMFISNNRTSFPLSWKENLVKHREVSKYYENNCRSRNLFLKTSASDCFCHVFTL